MYSKLVDAGSWVYAQTITTVTMFKDINTLSGNGSGSQYLTNANNTLYFEADDGVNGNELWKGVGTAVSTIMIE